MDSPLTLSSDATFTIDVYDTTALAKIVVPAFTLPSGWTWRTVITMHGTPSSKMPKPIVYRNYGRNFPGTTQTFRVNRPLDSNGKVFFSVVIQRQKGGTWTTYDSAVISGGNAVVPRAPAKRNPLPSFGVNVHVAIPRFREPGSLSPMLSHLAGHDNVQLVRAAAPWAYLQPASGPFDSAMLSQMDAFADWLRANNMKWMVALPGIAPSWETGSSTIAVPANMSDYANYINTFLIRYGDIVAVVENMNEPNSDNPLVGRLGFTYANLVTTQQTLYNTVKAHDTSIKVATPAIAFGDAPYLQSLYNNGIKPYFDLANIHPYDFRFDMVGTSGPSGNGNGVAADPAVSWPDEAGRPNSPTHGVQYVYETMQANGDGGKQIIVGEWGTSTSFTGQNQTKSTLDVTQAQQALYTRTAMRQAARDSRVYAFIIYMLYDNAFNAAGPIPYDIKSWFQGFGMMAPYGGYTKPALTAFLSTADNPA